MAKATPNQPIKHQTASTANQQLAAPGEDALPTPVARRGLDEATWRTLKNSVYPGASNDSILMAVDYCRARKLDVLKKPCHIVPMNVKDAKSGNYGWRDVILPGIYEYRITAHRTGLYIGRSAFEYGDRVEHMGLSVPEWCEVSVYRLFKEDSKERMEFRVRCYFSEVCNTKKEKDERGNKTGELVLNERWSRAPIQMLTKCTEAAALREAFPDEFGGEATAEEMAGHTMEVNDTTPARTGKPQTRPPRELPPQQTGRTLEHQQPDELLQQQPVKQAETVDAETGETKQSDAFRSLADENAEPPDEQEAGVRG
jgi:phage recombination protein Bet